MEDLLVLVIDQFLRAVTEEPFDRGALVDGRAVGRDHRDHVRGILEQRPIEAVDALQLLLVALLLRDVEHDAGKARPGRPGLDAHDVPQPHHPAVGRDHTVLEFVVLTASGGVPTERRASLHIVGVGVRHPEIRRGQPLGGWIAENRFGLIADEGELERAAVGFPHDAADRIHELAELLRRKHRA
jgi:hypothetical protein